MPERYYFDVENGKITLHDTEGVEAQSLEEALEEARSVISELANEVAGDNPGETWMLAVRDADGLLVGRLPIKK